MDSNDMSDSVNPQTDVGPDYGKYSLEQLQRARRNIDAERFPERTLRLEDLISERIARGENRMTQVEPHVRPLAYSQLRGSAWLRRSLAVISIWGGFSGALSLLLGLTQITDLFSSIVTLVLVGFYGWLCWAGVLLMEDRPGAVHHNQMLWGLQIPILLSPWLSYVQANGAIAALWIQLKAFSFGFNLNLGTQSRLLFDTAETGITIGVNFFAIAMIGLLVALEDRSDAQPAAPTVVQPDAVSET